MREFTTTEGKTLLRLSRWTRVHCDVVSKRHPLHYYSEPDSEYPGKGILFWFRFNGKKYALDQFICMNGMWATPVMFEDETGKLNYLSGYDSEDYYNPIMIEVSDDGEHVRVYQYL